MVPEEIAIQESGERMFNKAMKPCGGSAKGRSGAVPGAPLTPASDELRDVTWQPVVAVHAGGRTTARKVDPHGRKEGGLRSIRGRDDALAAGSAASARIGRAGIATAPPSARAGAE
jgi:hypothetical protein